MSVEDILPLTPLQEGMLFHAVSAGGPGTYLQQYTYVLEGPVDPAGLERAYGRLVARHQALRTGFVWTGVDRPLQVVRSPDDVTLPFETVDLRGRPAAEQDERMDAVLAGQKAAGFDLEKPPLVRVAAVRVADERTVVLVTDHHLVVDGWSANLLSRELLQLLAGREDALPPPAPARDYLAWLATRPDPAAYWRSVLGDVTAPTPLGVDRRGMVTPADRPVDWQRAERTDPLDPVRLDGLRAAGLLPSTLVHAAWALTLARQAQVDDVLLGVTVAGRPAGLAGAESRIGMFVNTLPLRVPVLGPVPVRAWLADVQRRLAEAREWEHTPLAVAQDGSGVPRGTPLFESVLAVQNYTGALPAPAAPVRITPGRIVEHTSLPVSIAAAVTEDGIWSRVDSDARRLDPEAAERMQRRFHAYAAGLLSDLDRPVRTVPEPFPSPVAEGPPVLPAPVTGSVHGRDRSLTAAEVAGLAGGVRTWLAAQPAGPVGLALGASAYLAPAVLGAAGRPIVPLDPRDPGPVGCAVVLTAGDLLVPTPGVPRLDLATVSPGEPVWATADPFGFVAGETVTAVAPVSAAVVTGALAAGARLRLLDPVLDEAPATGPLGRRRLHRDALLTDEEGRDGEGIPLGRPLPGVRAAIAGAVPQDTAGELELNGVRTGDQVRFRPDGVLELVGLEDTVRVEAALRRLPGVTDAAVPDAGTAYVATDLPVTAIRRGLLRVVPPHRLPRLTLLPAAAPVPRPAPEETAGPPGPPPGPGPIEQRLDQLPADRKAAFLAGLDDAADRLRLPDADRETLLRWADGGVADVPDVSLGALIEAVAAERPEAVAVDDGAELTYADLVADARRLARLLIEQGVGDEARVAVCLPRTAASVTALLGILLAGGTYVPVDASFPAARVRYVLDDAEVVAAVTVAALRDRFTGLPVVELDRPPAGDPGPLERTVHPGRSAYVLYTSGSTGTPKGVVVEHRAVVDFVTTIAAAYRIDGRTRLLGFATLGFDISVFEVFTALAAGATLVLANDEDRLSADRLQRLMVERHVTVAELPPAIMPQLRPDELTELRLVSVGGEAPAGALVDAWSTVDREFWNGYGPTEATVAVTLMRCVPPSGGRVPPIGRPMPNHRAYVLDDRLRLVPPGQPGELCVAGPGLARGYTGPAEQTTARFRPDPYGPPGTRLYRTGDLARWRPDGNLEFLGRVDRQVKIRGYRIELGEVEAAIRTAPGVRDAVVEAWDDPGGTRQLVAWTTGRPVELAELREVAAATLPPYMLPTRVVHLAELPLTPTGKVDRAALPPPGDGAGPPAERPEDPLQAALVELVAPLAGVPGLGVDEDFFAVGGNSLQATQVLSRVRDAFGVEVSLPEFFAEPTVARLAELLADARPESPAPVRTADPGTGTEVAPLAPQQGRVWRVSTADPSRSAFHLMVALRVRGPLDLDALRASFDAVVRHQPALRTTLEVRDGEPVQVVHPRPRVPFEVQDVSGEPDPEHAAAQAVLREYERPFDLAAGPPLRARVLRLGPDDAVFCWCTHHALSDGWSVGVQLRELFQAYPALAAGRDAPQQPPLGATYADYARAERDRLQGPRPDQEREWWRAQLAGAPRHLDLRSAGGTPPGYRSLDLTGALAEAVAGLTASAGSTAYMVLLAAVGALVAERTGETDVLVVSPIAGRVRSEWEPVVGFFANRVTLRLDLSGSPSMTTALRRARAAAIAAYAHQAMPFDQLLAELGPDRPALPVLVALNNYPGAGQGIAGLDLGPAPDETDHGYGPMLEFYSPEDVPFALAVSLTQFGDALLGGVEWDGTRFGGPDAAEFADRLLLLLAAAAERPDVPLDALLPHR